MVDFMGTLNLTQLRTFLAVRKHLSYTRAAEEVYLSQPAVSRQIQQLERDLGVSLFEQIGKKLCVTDAGQTLAAQAQTLLSNLDRVAESVAAHQSLDTGRLRIGAGTTPGFYLLPQLLGRFHRQHPGIELDYAVDNSRAVEQMVLHNDVDLGFIGGPPSHDILLTEPIAKDEVVCFVGKSHKLAGSKSVSAKQLDGQTWIIRRHGSATRELFESWLSRSGCKIGRTIELGCPEAIRSIVAAGIGIGYLSSLAIAAELRGKRLKQLSVAGLKLTRTIHLVRHADKHLSPAIRKFLELVRSTAS